MPERRPEEPDKDGGRRGVLTDIAMDVVLAVVFGYLLTVDSGLIGNLWIVNLAALVVVLFHLAKGIVRLAKGEDRE